MGLSRPIPRRASKAHHSYMLDPKLFAASVVRALRFAPGTHPSPLAIAERAMGAACYAEGARAGVHRMGDVAHQIVVPRHLPPPGRHWAFTRELAGWLLEVDGVPLTTGRRCEVAEALLLPEPAVVAAEPMDVARRIVAPVAATLLRHGRVRDVETAIVGRGWSRFAGPERRLPRDPGALAALAAGRVAGLRVRRIVTPGEAEVVLVAA